MYTDKKKYISSINKHMNSFFVIFSQVLKNNNYLNKSSLFLETIASLLNQPSKWIDTSQKYNSFNDLIYTFPYFSSDEREELIHLFQKSQRHYFSLHRFLHRCLRMLPSVQGTNLDLELQPLSNISDEWKVSLWENHRNYVFKLTDLLRIIRKSLTLSLSFFPDPRHPFNPYTNLPFSDCSLYRIYYAVKRSPLPCCTVLQLYYESGFCLVKLVSRHEYYLRKIIVKDFLLHASLYEKTDYIRSMLHEFSDCVNSLILHASFPEEKLAYDMRLFLKTYLAYQTEVIDAKRVNLRRKLRRWLQAFASSKPMWGRMIISKSTYDEYYDNLPLVEETPWYIVDDALIDSIDDQWADVSALLKIANCKNRMKLRTNRRKRTKKH